MLAVRADATGHPSHATALMALEGGKDWRRIFFPQVTERAKVCQDPSKNDVTSSDDQLLNFPRKASLLAFTLLRHTSNSHQNNMTSRSSVTC